METPFQKCSNLSNPIKRKGIQIKIYNKIEEINFSFKEPGHRHRNSLLLCMHLPSLKHILSSNPTSYIPRKVIVKIDEGFFLIRQK